MSKTVYRVRGRGLETLDYTPGMDIANGDVYGFDDPDARIIWIWVGSKSSVEESTVAAWFINKIDQKRGGVPEVMNIEEGAEPMLFRENWTINVIDDDTPGFLEKAELDYVEYKLFRIFTEVETELHDETTSKEVEISRNSLDSGDVFVLDGNDVIYCWIGKGANLEEKLSGQKLMQKIDADRNYTPIQYTIYEGDNDNWEEAFYELLDKIESMDPEDRKTVSVEDQRELEYVAEEAKSVDQHKAQIDATYQTTDPDKIPERMIQAGSDEHKKMITGSSVKLDELPQQGTVAARLAAINARKEGEPTPEPESRKPSEIAQQQTPMKSASIKSPPSAPPGAPISSAQKEPEMRQEIASEPAKEEIKPDTPKTDPLEVSKTYGGAPMPALTELESGSPSEDTEPTLDLSKVKGDCVALGMHFTVWSAGKGCSVCGMAESDCPNHENHKVEIQSGNKCSVCAAAE